MKENNVLNELYELQCDYANGRGGHGPVLEAFSRIIDEYQKSFEAWMPFHDKQIEEKVKLFEWNYKKILITEGILLLIFLFIHAEYTGYILWYVCSLVIGVILAKNGKDQIWGYLMVILMLIALPVGFACQAEWLPWIVFLGIMGAFAAHIFAIKVKNEKRLAFFDEENKKQVIFQKEMEANMKECQIKLLKMLPQLKVEFEQVRERFIQDNREMLTKEQQQMFAELPKVFWWEVSAKKLIQLEKELLDGRDDPYDISWDTKAIERSLGSEYKEAGCEYSPLNGEYMDIALAMKDYDKNKVAVASFQTKGKIVDFITVAVSSSVGSETVTYKDYCLNDIQRLAKTMEWDAIGNDIENAHGDGILDDEYYTSINSYYHSKSLEAYSLINQQEEKTYERQKEIKSATFLWTGQLLLVPDKKMEGGYLIADYRCQFQHMFENLEALRGYNITGICGDVLKRNPVFMAKVHKIFPMCR